MSDDNSQEWFIQERSCALAMIHLTRRDDLAVTNAGPASGLRFLVSITREKGQPSGRQFGVILRGAFGPLTEGKVHASLLAGEFPYPVCLFFFTMADDQGYYAWVAEPDVTADGPRLLMHDGPPCRKLDRAALDEIVERVDRWYDAFFSRIAVKAS